MAEGETTDDTFAKLKALGVRLALDDFGTGYSSLGYLKKAPFDKIKIDQSFVRGAASTSATNRNAAIIRAIVTLAETLGMDTCAEGVETHDDLQLIRELGVSMVQGYIFGRPGPAEAARELANSVTVEADGFQCSREPRHRLMRRAITIIDGTTIEVKLRNISSMGALVECDLPVSPATELAIDIVGVGPVRGIVRWAQSGKFGVQFGKEFDLAHSRAQARKAQSRDHAPARFHRPARRRRPASGLRPADGGAVLAIEIIEIDDRRAARHRRQIGDVERYRSRQIDLLLGPCALGTWADAR